MRRDAYYETPVAETIFMERRYESRAGIRVGSRCTANPSFLTICKRGRFRNPVLPLRRRMKNPGSTVEALAGECNKAIS